LEYDRVVQDYTPLQIRRALRNSTASRDINEAGWAVSVPRVAMPQPNTPLWFDAEGYLHFPETLHGQECRIIDMQGRQLFQTKALDYFPKPDLPPGIYILQITNPRNHESQSFKLYKQ
jgi:hypothetical protein